MSKRPLLALSLLALSCDKDKTPEDTGSVQCGEDQYLDVDGSCVDYVHDTGDTDEVDTGEGPDPVECDIEAVMPEDGETDAYYRTHVEVTLSDVDPAATIELFQDGTEVPGSLAWDDEVLHFLPTDALGQNTSYEVVISACSTSLATGFTTGTLGEPLDGPAAELIGKSYVIELDTARFVKPPGVGPMLATQLTTDLLVTVLDANETTIDLLGATSLEGSLDQDFCEATIDYPVADFSEQPYFAVTGDIELNMAGYAVPINNFVLAGTFTADGSEIGGGVIAGLIDTRPLVALIDPDASDDYFCELVTGFGAECVDCPDGSGEYCLELLADQIQCEQIETAVEVVEQQDCHEQCDASADNPECEL